MENLLTIQQVADHLQISRRTVYTLIERGDLNIIKIGALTRIKQSELKKYIDERTNK